MIKSNVEMIREYIKQDHKIEISSEDKISYIEQYQLNIVENVENIYEKIHLLVAIDGIIKFEIEQLIEEYINDLPNRKDDIRKIAEEITPRQIKDCYFEQYEMTL